MSTKSFAKVSKKFKLNRFLLNFLFYFSPNVYYSRILLVCDCDYAKSSLLWHERLDSLDMNLL